MEDGFRRGRAASTIFYHPKTQVRVVVHGDDFTYASTVSELKKIKNHVRMVRRQGAWHSRHRKAGRTRDRDIVNSTPHTSHFSQCCTTNDTHTFGSSCKFGVRTSRVMCHPHALSLLSIFSLIILSFLLAINFIFHDVVDKFPVHSS